MSYALVVMFKWGDVAIKRFCAHRLKPLWKEFVWGRRVIASLCTCKVI